jgi:hypothetical protein
MRRAGWVVVVAVAWAVAVPVGVPAAGVTLQQTVPAPDFNNDGFGDLAVGVPGEDVGATADAGAVNVLYGSAGGLGAAQVLTQGAGGVPGASELFDRFGTALATGDFNGDAFADLAVGAPGEDLGTDTDAGAVFVLFGSAAGITGAGGRLLTQANPEPGDGFGSALATVDGTDLAVGVPGEDVGSAGGAGAVSLVDSPGSAPSEQLLYQGAAGVAGSSEAGDGFGSSLGAGDFNDSEGIDSLAVGVPGEDVGAVADAGAVIVRYAPGFSGVGLEVITQGRPETGDRFGTALGAADFGGTTDQDLAAGAPGETVGTSAGAGAVTVLYGDPSGFVAAGSQLFHQSGGGVPGTAETGDGLGAAVAAGQFGGGVADLAIGVPGEDIGAVGDAGILDVLYGTDTGRLGGGGSEQLTQQDGAGAVEAGDRFGASLSKPFLFESDVLEDVAVGAPGETVGGRAAAGAGSALFGADTGGLGNGGSQFFFSGSGGLGGAAETGDLAGAAFS